MRVFNKFMEILLFIMKLTMLALKLINDYPPINIIAFKKCILTNLLTLKISNFTEQV